MSARLRTKGRDHRGVHAGKKSFRIVDQGAKGSQLVDRNPEREAWALEGTGRRSTTQLGRVGPTGSVAPSGISGGRRRSVVRDTKRNRQLVPEASPPGRLLPLSKRSLLEQPPSLNNRDEYSPSPTAHTASCTLQDVSSVQESNSPPESTVASVLGGEQNGSAGKPLVAGGPRVMQDDGGQRLVEKATQAVSALESRRVSSLGAWQLWRALQPDAVSQQRDSRDAVCCLQSEAAGPRLDGRVRP